MKSMEQKCSSGLRNRFDRRMQMRINARPSLPSNPLQESSPTNRSPLFLLSTHSLREKKKTIFNRFDFLISSSREGATIVFNNSLFAEKIVYEATVEPSFRRGREQGRSTRCDATAKRLGRQLPSCVANHGYYANEC